MTPRFRAFMGWVGTIAMVLGIGATIRIIGVAPSLLYVWIAKGEIPL
jgi:hypothetical protein